MATVCNLREGRMCSTTTYLSDVDLLSAFFPQRDA